MKFFNPFTFFRAAKAMYKGRTADFILDEAQKVIRSRIEEGRVKFIDSETVEYTDKTGETKRVTFNEIARMFIDISGKRNEMSNMGLGDNDIEQIFREEYDKGR